MVLVQLLAVSAQLRQLVLAAEDEGARWRRWTMRPSRSGAELLVVPSVGELGEQGWILPVLVHRPPKSCAERGSWQEARRRIRSLASVVILSPFSLRLVYCCRPLDLLLDHLESWLPLLLPSSSVSLAILSC